MENFKRSVKRLLTRLTILGLVVICGAIAIAQVQKQNVAKAQESQLEQSDFSFGNDAGLPIPDDKSVRIEPGYLADSASDAQPILKPAQAQLRGIQNGIRKAQAAGSRFVDNTRLVAAQAVGGSGDVSTADFDQALPGAGPDAGGFSSELPPSGLAAPSGFNNDASVAPPEFGNDASFDQAAQFSVDAPEFIGGDAPAPPSNAPELPSVNATQFANEFPSPNSSFATEPPQLKDSGVAAPRFSQPDPAASQFANDPPPERANPVRSAVPVESSFPSSARTRNTQLETQIQPQVPAGGFSNDAFNGQNTAQPANSFSGGNSGFGGASELPEPGGYGSSPSYGAAGQGGQGVGPTGNSVSLTGNGTPGPRELEGPQTASLTIQKLPPKQVRVGEPVTFKVRVRNNGSTPAERVLIRDQVPRGTQLVDTQPQAKTDSGGGVFWEIGTLPPNQDITVSMQVTPQEEGLIGSVATVSFEAMASAQVDVKKPELKIQHTTKDKVLVGDTVRFAITIQNPGSGVAKDVKVEEDVPAGLAHSRGPRLEYSIGDIAPGAQRRLELTLKAAKPGFVTNIIRARGASGLVSEHEVKLQVVSPQLQVKIKGPNTRYLERPASYTVSVENAGTADAENVELVMQLDRGLKFVNTENNGRYDSSAHAIHWMLRRLPAGEYAPVRFTVNPQQKGQFNLNAVATADRNLRDAKDHPLKVQGIAALLFEVADQVDPIEVGKMTTYSIQVTNQGTEDASNVQFVAQVPPGMTAAPPSGVSNYQIRGDQILFAPIARLAAKDTKQYTVRLKGLQAGDQRFKVRMTSDDTSTPVHEEESTRVYSDEQ